MGLQSGGAVLSSIESANQAGPDRPLSHGTRSPRAEEAMILLLDDAACVPPARFRTLTISRPIAHALDCGGSAVCEKRIRATRAKVEKSTGEICAPFGGFPLLCRRRVGREHPRRQHQRSSGLDERAGGVCSVVGDGGANFGGGTARNVWDACHLVVLEALGR